MTIFADILIEESGLGRVRSEHGRTVTKRLVKFLQRFNVVFSNVQHGVYHSVALTKHPAHCPAGHFFFFFFYLSPRASAQHRSAVWTSGANLSRRSVKGECNETW